MLAANTPPKFPKIWGQNAQGPFIRQIPVDSQIGINAGFASLNDGFPPLTMTPIAAGGVPPFGQDMNGILNQITGIQQWQQAGGGWQFDANFVLIIGGYPQGAILNSKVVLGRRWVSTVDKNMTDPDSVSAGNWATPAGDIQVGTPVPCFSSSVPFGYVPANGLTIGNSASNASQRANSDTLLLYRFVWINFSNLECPLLSSAGAAIARGANPDADYNANNQLTLPNAKGAALIGVDGMGGSASAFLNSVPTVIGNTTAPGSIIGENLHALSAAENGPHNHQISDPSHAHSTNAQLPTASANTVVQQTFPAFFNFVGATINPATTGISVVSSGGGAPHNTVSRSISVYWNLAL